jgi:hypothetical protein
MSPRRSRSSSVQRACSSIMLQSVFGTNDPLEPWYGTVALIRFHDHSKSVRLHKIDALRLCFHRAWKSTP